MSTAKTAGLSTVVAGFAGAAAFLRFVRPWYRHWGAAQEDISRPMLLDGDIASPVVNTTMAIAVDAAPDQVWPWIAQIGDPPRAGYYSYTWIERLLGMDVQNVAEVLPQYQSPLAGAAVDRNGTMLVKAVEPGRQLVLGPPEGLWIRCTWAIGVFPAEGGSSKLVTRVRGHWSWAEMLRQTPPLTWPLYLLIEPGAFVMERKMLIEIKKRAEALADTTPAGPEAAR